MKHILLASTAFLTLAATAVIAQDTSSSSSSEPMSSESSMMSTESSMMSSESSMMDMSSSMEPAAPITRVPVDVLAGYSVVDSDMLVSRILNLPVYNGTEDGAEQIGTINDLILNADGSVAAVVLGVGGFLGLGEKQVAVDYSALQFTVAADNTERYVLQTTVEDLTAAPDFQIVDDNAGDAMAPDPSASSSAM